MNRQTDIDKRVNKALESLEGIQKAEPVAFFFTRVKARLLRDEKSIWETTGAWMARPAVAIAGLLLILTMNVFFLFEKDNTIESSASYTSQNTEEEYVLTAATNTSYDYENIEP